MEKEMTSSAILRFLRTVALIDLGILIAVSLICWFGGWRTAHYYGNGLMLAGVIALALGTYSVTGNWGTTRSFEYQYAGSVGVEDADARIRRDWKDLGRSFSFLGLMTGVALGSIGAGILIQTVLK